MHYVEMSVLQKFLALLILKAAPQDLPYSLQLNVKLATVYILSGIMVLRTTVSPDNTLAGILLGLLVQFVFTYLVLRALHKSLRFTQTFSAMLGVSILFNLLSWPVFALLADATIDDSFRASLSMVFLLVISWEVLVKAHIFRHALEMKMFSALALSLSLFFISVALSQLFFTV
jgi:hypothetical protein